LVQSLTLIDLSMTLWQHLPQLATNTPGNFYD